MIEVKNLHMNFGSKDVLRGIDAVFESHKTNLIIGRSGAGKSVLLKCIIGLFQASRGGVYYDGQNIFDMTKSEILNLRQHMGMLFQGSALFDSMTILENVIFPMEMFWNGKTAEYRKKGMELLERVDLLDAADRYPSEISGGMMKRTAIARAIALRPRYLFCDEPNSGLDPNTSLIIDQLIREITLDYGITTIINTHDMNTVKTIGDKIIFIQNGLKAWEGSSQTIESNGTDALIQFINSNQ